MSGLTVKPFQPGDEGEIVKLGHMVGFRWSEKDYLEFYDQGREWPGKKLTISYPSKIILCLADNFWTAGTIGYELLLDSYRIEFCLVHPSLEPEVMELLVHRVINKAITHPIRKTVVHYVPDDDRIGVEIPRWTKLGFKSSLMTNFFDDRDGWKLAWTAPE